MNGEELTHDLCIIFPVLYRKHYYSPEIEQDIVSDDTGVTPGEDVVGRSPC